MEDGSTITSNAEVIEVLITYRQQNELQPKESDKSSTSHDLSSIKELGEVRLLNIDI